MGELGELGELGEWESGRVGGVGEWELGEWVGGLGRAVFLFWFLGLAYASAGGLLYVAACSIWQPAHTKAVAEPPVFFLLLESSRIQGPVRVDLTREVLSLGAVHVRELGRTDWLGLNSWSRLREMEQRRVLAAVGL